MFGAKKKIVFLLAIVIIASSIASARAELKNKDQLNEIAATINSCTIISSPGTYTLSKDLLANTTPCIAITSSNVTLDGAGHLLDGRNSTIAIDVYNPQTALTNVNIKNMRLYYWFYAIRYRATTLSTLSNNHI